MTRETYEKAREKALALFEKAHIVLTDAEKENLEVADFGLGDLDNTGLEIVTYINTERCCSQGNGALPAPDLPRAYPCAL